MKTIKPVGVLQNPKKTTNQLQNNVLQALSIKMVKINYAFHIAT